MKISGINDNYNVNYTKQQNRNPFIKQTEEADVLIKTKTDKSQDGRFTFDEALKNFGKGIISPITAMIKHPVMTVATLVVAGTACYFVPVLTPVMGIGFGALSVFQLGKGCYDAAKEYKNGNYDNSEKAFEQIGQGAVSTVLSVLGLKQNARIAAEAKTMNKLNVTTLDAEQKAQIAKTVSKGSRLKALKETLSLFTTKEGRQAALRQFKPDMLKTRFTELKNVATGKLVEKRKKVTYKKPVDKIKEFKASKEGQRRAALSDEQIQKEVETLFDKAFDELEIPKEQRPKLKIFKDSVQHGGGYNISTHTLEFNPESYKSGLFEMDDTIMHEATHCKEALLRARIPQDRVDSIVRDNLTNRIINGESEEILVRGGLLRPEMMEPPKMSASMKKDFAQLADEMLYKKSGGLSKDLIEYCSQKDCIAGNSQYTDLDKLAESEKALQPLLTRLQDLINKNPDFASQYKSADEALTALSKYSLSHCTRYNSFTDVSINYGRISSANLPDLSPEEMLRAEQSLIDNITTMEGNCRIAGFNRFFAGEGAFNQYQFSPEEVLAEQNGNKFLIKNLSSKLAEMKKAGTLSPEDEAFMNGLIKKANLTIEYKTKGLDYYQKYTELLSNPNNEELAAAVKQLESELKTLSSAINPKETETVTEFMTVLERQELLTHGTPSNITALINELKNKFE